MTQWVHITGKPQVTLAATGWSGAIDISTVTTIPAWATHVVVEIANTSATGGQFGARVFGDSTAAYTLTARFRWYQILPIPADKKLEFYSGNLTNIKCYLHTFTSHPNLITSQDAFSVATLISGSKYSIDCGASGSPILPSGAASGSAILKINTVGTKTLAVAGTGNAASHPLARHLPDGLRIAPLDTNRKFEVNLSAALVAGEISIAGWMAPGCLIPIASPALETGTAAYSDLATVVTGDAALVVTKTSSGSSQIYDVQPGGTTTGSKNFFALTGGNVQIVIPDVNGKVAQISTDSTVQFYVVGSIAANVSAATLDAIDQLVENATSTATFSAAFAATQFTLLDADGVSKVCSTTGGTGVNRTFTPPQIQDETVGLRMGSLAVTAYDGASTTNVLNKAYSKSGYTYVDITDVGANNIGVTFSVTMAPGDQISYEASKGTADQYGGYTSLVDGVRTLWHRSLADKKWRSVDVTVVAAVAVRARRSIGLGIGIGL